MLNAKRKETSQEADPSPDYDAVTERQPQTQPLRFIDLFAGLGGFHLALDGIEAECVLASELNAGLQKLYKDNFGIEPLGDVRKIEPEQVPAFDLLCAGFPCQSFSKAGLQLGLKCEENGDLIHKVIDIIRSHHPTYLMLENVPNLARHNGGQTWRTIRNALEDEGYEVDYEFYSPHEFGIPQVRERMFIVGSRLGLQDFVWPEKTGETPSIRSVLAEVAPSDARKLSKQLDDCLHVWQKFLNLFPADEELPSFPIWTMEFGADYPIEGTPPRKLPLKELKKYRGAYGVTIKARSQADALAFLPSHATNTDEPFPRWKTTFIRQNREFYERHKDWLDGWLTEIRRFPPSLQKFEWNCKGEVRDLWRHVLQVRASGVRVKRDNTAPSLIAMTTTQVPIIGWQKRYMTPQECARLQSVPPTHKLPDTPTAAYMALGNAVNVELVRRVAEALLLGKRNAHNLFSQDSFAELAPAA